MALSGCAASQYTAKTTASFVKADGTRFDYFNEKDVAGADVTYEVDEKGNVKKIHFKLDKSGTPEAAISAAANANQAMAELLKSLLPMIEKAAALGAGS